MPRIAWQAIEVARVISCNAKCGVSLAGTFCLLLKKIVEHRFPCARMYCRRICNHAVKVEQHTVELQASERRVNVNSGFLFVVN